MQDDIEQHPPDFRTASRRSLQIALALTTSFMVAEVVGGLVANSLALLADAAHMITDAASLGLALLAMWVASKPASARLTFGFHRTEILAALLNVFSLWLIAAWVVFEAYRRFQQPPDVQGVITLSVGSAGLLVNIAAALVLRRSAGESLNVEGAFLHVIGDMLGSIGIVAAGILIIAFGWYIADPIFGVVIAVLILFSSTRLLWKVLRVLMQGTPSGINIQHLCQQLEQVKGVKGIHDIHTWSLTSGYDVFDAHVTIDPTLVGERKRLLQNLRTVINNELGRAHVTIQLEESEEGCEETHHVAHSNGRS